MVDVALASDPRVTADEFLEIPDDGLRRELVRGEVRIMSPAGRSHGKVALRLGSRLERYVDEHGLGEAYAAETGFRVFSDPDTVLAPDVSFVRRDRLEALGEAEGLIPGAPDLAVEVVSPRDKFSDVEEKVFDWLAAGCRMVVLVNPRRRTATVYRSTSALFLLTENDVLDGGDVVPGWTLPLRELFG
jgi:Uma2 family endonuclease